MPSGLFNQTVFDPATGTRQGEMFDSAHPPSHSVPIAGSKSALDPHNTGKLFQGKPAMATETEGHWVTIDGAHILIKDSIGSGKGFSRAALHAKLLHHHTEAAGGEGGRSAAADAEFNNAGRGHSHTTFHKELPGEVKRYLEGNKNATRLFRTTQDAAKAGGADAMADLGEDKYFKHIDQLSGSAVNAALEHARGSNDPEVRFAALIHDNLPAHSERVPMGSVDAGKLKTGQQFTMQGIPFRVTEDADGYKVLAGAGEEFPAEALGKVPVDRGSLRQTKAPKIKADAVAPFGRSDKPLFYVLSNGEAVPALMLGQGFPKQRNGFACEYWWRQAIQDGDWTHPAKGFTVHVDPSQRQQWEQNFRRMQRLGDEVPVVKDHKDHDADATLGYVVDVRQNGPWYEELHQYLGEKAKDTALKNKLSVGIDPNYTDVKRNNYGSAIVHSAITSRPVIPGQGDAVLAASQNDDAATPERFYLTLATPEKPAPSVTAAPAVVDSSTASIPQPAPSGSRRPDMATLNCSEENFSALKTILPAGETLTADTAVGAALQELQRLTAHAEADAGGPEVIAKLSRADVIETAVRNRQAVRASEQRLAAEATTLRGEVAELSKRVPKALDPESEAAMKQAVRTSAEQLVREGCIQPSTKDLLLSVLVESNGKTNTFTLTRATNLTGDKSLALAVLDALRGNHPVPLGEHTGLQALGRVVPGDTTSAEEKKTKAASDMFNKHLTAGMATAK